MIKTTLRRRKGRESVVNVNQELAPQVETMPLTPKNTFLSAYKKVSNSIRIESMDYLQTVSESILTRMKSKEIDLSSWEFQSTENMTIYIKGCINRRQIKTEQSKAVIDCISFEEITGDLGSTQYTPKVDLFDWIRNAKRYNKKPLFSQTEQRLIVEYYEQGKSIRHIAKDTSQSRMMVQRQLESISQRIAKLPIRDLHGFIESQGVKTSVRVQPKEFKPLVTRIGLLRRYRRSKDKLWLTKYNDNSERVLTEHECRTNSKTNKTRCFEPGSQLQVNKAQGKRVSIKARQQLNQDMIDLIMPEGNYNRNVNSVNPVKINKATLKGLCNSKDKLLCVKGLPRLCALWKLNHTLDTMLPSVPLWTTDNLTT